MTAAFNASDTAILVDFKGLDVPAVTELRRQIRGAKAQYKVVKNTLAKRAAKGTRLAALEAHFEGTTAVACTSALPFSTWANPHSKPGANTWTSGERFPHVTVHLPCASVTGSEPSAQTNTPSPTSEPAASCCASLQLTNAPATGCPSASRTTGPGRRSCRARAAS